VDGVLVDIILGVVIFIVLAVFTL